MCLACEWGKSFRVLNVDNIASPVNSLSRRGFLQTGAATALAAIGTAQILKAPKSVAQVGPPNDAKADIIFRNGPVYTVNREQAWAQAVAVQGKSIVYVGDEAGVQRFEHSGTRIVDLKGKMLLPGFVEGHIHPIVGAALTRGVDLQLNTKEEILTALKAYRSKLGNVEVVRGFGWRYNALPATGPRKEDLDSIWPDTPVVLIAIDGHSAWVNSKALALANITKETKDPVPGFSFFQRDPATGELTGWLVEVPAIEVVLMAAAPLTPDYIAKALVEWLPEAAAAGITSIFDAGMILIPEEEGFGLYSDLEQQGKLPFRVVGSFYHFDPSIDPVPLIKALRQQFQSELVQASVLKLNIDGGDAQHTAAMLAPYSDKPETSGDTLLPPELLKDIVLRADREGIDMHFHSFGDRATRLSLDAIEAAIKANPQRDRRHTLAHLVYVDEQDFPRLGELGVLAQFSAQWAVPDLFWQQITQKRWGQRADNTYRVGSMLRNGAVLSLGTDWPAASYYSTFRPLDAIEVAITRQELGKPQDAPVLPPQDDRISLEEALHGNTMGAARQLGLEGKVGSIEVGKLADLVVLDKNLFEVPPHEIHKTKVLMTTMNGNVTYG